MKNPIRAVMAIYITISVVVVSCCIASLTSMNKVYASVVIEPIVGEPISVSSQSHAKSLSDSELLSTTFETSLQGSTEKLTALIDENTDEVVGSISMKVSYGTIETEPISLNSNAVMSAYREERSIPSWDYKEKISVIAALWEFLVGQQNVEEHMAASIIGTLMDEGVFGEEQGSHAICSSIEDARAKISNHDKGYGIVQWTYYTRQNALLQYYELANELYSDDWDRVCVVAECCMLLRELEAYQVFDDLHSYTTIEDAVGRLCVLYEGYEGCYQQWSSGASGYSLVSNSGSGYDIYHYALHIYEYFSEG